MSCLHGEIVCRIWLGTQWTRQLAVCLTRPEEVARPACYCRIWNSVIRSENGLWLEVSPRALVGITQAVPSCCFVSFLYPLNTSTAAAKVVLNKKKPPPSQKTTTTTGKKKPTATSSQVRYLFGLDGRFISQPSIDQQWAQSNQFHSCVLQGSK